MLKLTGFKELENALLKLPSELSKVAEANALRYGMIPVRKTAQAITRSISDTGLLARSIGLTVRRVRKKGNAINRYTARVGARSGFRVTVGTNKKTGRPIVKDPTKYAHLVEYGTSHSAAKPFIRPALEANESAIIEGMERGYEIGLAKAVAKLRKK